MWRFTLGRLFRAGKIILISGVFLTGIIQPVQAEPYLRVCKNGVIYYYFSNRGEGRARKLPINTGKIRLYPAPAATRLSPRQVDPTVHEASRYHNLPASLVKAIIKVESNFNPAATSPKGAQGLMQLMPETADHLQVCNPYDLRENIWAGTRYLRMLLERFNNHLPLALAAYNAGPQRVEQCQKIPPIKETQDFVRAVCANFLYYSRERPQ